MTESPSDPSNPSNPSDQSNLPASGVLEAGAPEALADRVVSAVTAVPGVAAMHSGMFGEVATHLSGRRVRGVQLRDDLVEVHITLNWAADLLTTADAVRHAAGVLVGRPVRIVIEDVLAPTESNSLVDR